ncbi:MAG: hypothetical protein ACH37Z_04530 [Anaerolineae bacterium]|nr:hypothetical protein [Ardenticatenia bacterium]HQZ70284.1 hypothetical protein [Anaerolineae bacterium]
MKQALKIAVEIGQKASDVKNVVHADRAQRAEMRALKRIQFMQRTHGRQGRPIRPPLPGWPLDDSPDKTHGIAPMADNGQIPDPVVLLAEYMDVLGPVAAIAVGAAGLPQQHPNHLLGAAGGGAFCRGHVT